jgi:hypothetical protein
LVGIGLTFCFANRAEDRAVRRYETVMQKRHRA